MSQSKPRKQYTSCWSRTNVLRIKPLNSVRAEIERILITQESERLQKKYIDRLKKKTFVRFFLKTPESPRDTRCYILS